jgi:hypothetical protein
VRAALWTPSPLAPWVEALRAALGPEPELLLVGAEPEAPPPCDVDLYHVAGTPAHGFVYRALLRRPGVVLLAQWWLHDLVHAETAGRGDPRAYRLEARRAHGDTGEFVARQVLAGLGGALPALLAMNQRVLESSLALVAFSEAVRARAAAGLPGRPVLHLALDRLDPASAEAAATALRALVREAAARVPERTAHAPRGGAAGERALVELGWVSRELGLPGPPADARRLVAALFEGGR